MKKEFTYELGTVILTGITGGAIFGDYFGTMGAIAGGVFGGAFGVFVAIKQISRNVDAGHADSK